MQRVMRVASVVCYVRGCAHGTRRCEEACKVLLGLYHLFDVLEDVSHSTGWSE